MSEYVAAISRSSGLSSGATWRNTYVGKSMDSDEYGSSDISSIFCLLK